MADIFEKLLTLIPAYRRSLQENEELQGEIAKIKNEEKQILAQLGKYQKENKSLKEKLDDKVQGMLFPAGHFHSPIPSLEEARRYFDQIYNKEKKLYSIDLNDEEQMILLERFFEYYKEVPFTEQKTEAYRYHYQNEHFKYSDAIFLHCMLRYIKPKRVIEIGSGYSTAVILDTNEHFLENWVTPVCIESYPERTLSLLKEEDKQKLQIVQKPLQEVEKRFFSQLEEDDILFIQSSHVSKFNSDVNYIIHEILPNLNRGVYICFQGVFPYFEYPRSWVEKGIAWNEMYVLRAFLEYNAAFKIVCFNRYLVEKYKKLLTTKMPLCLKFAGEGLWIKKESHYA